MHQGVRRAHMALHQVLIGGDAMSQGSVTNACSGRPSMRNLQGCCVQSGGSRPPGTGHGQARNATATSAARCRRWRRAAASASACSGFRHRSQCEPRGVCTGNAPLRNTAMRCTQLRQPMQRAQKVVLLLTSACNCELLSLCSVVSAACAQQQHPYNRARMRTRHFS